MDPISHTLVGGALAQTGLGRRTTYATAALIIGANLPDVDALSYLLGWDAGLAYRRGWTHGLPAVVVLPFLLTGLLVLWHRWAPAERRENPAPNPRRLLTLSFLAVATHPSLDWLNTYGMRWWMPFDGRWFYGDALFIVDPWMWLTLGGAVFLAHSRTAVSQIGWAGGAVLATLLLFAAVPKLVAAKALWLAGLGVLIGLRARGVFQSGARARALATVALLFALFVIGLWIVSARWARRVAAEMLAERGIEVERLMVGPVPVTPFVRDVVVATPDAYRYGTLELRLRPRLNLDPRAIPKPAETPVVLKALGSPEIRGFMTWVRFPFVEVEKSDEPRVVYVMDARYTRERTLGFGGTRVELMKD
ncbi:MAG: metal-dependent hydrolase [Acidobacteriota bacterium]